MEVLNVALRVNKESDMSFSLKILIVMIRAHDGSAECCLNWNIYIRNWH